MQGTFFPLVNMPNLERPDSCSSNVEVLEKLHTFDCSNDALIE